MRNRFLLACWLVVGVAHVACHGQATPLKAEIKLIRTSVKNNELFWIATSIRNASGAEQSLVAWSCSYSRQWITDNSAVSAEGESCLQNTLAKIKLRPGASYKKNVQILVALPAGNTPRKAITFRLGFASEDDPMAPRPKSDPTKLSPLKFEEPRVPSPRLWSNAVTLHVVGSISRGAGTALSTNRPVNPGSGSGGITITAAGSNTDYEAGEATPPVLIPPSDISITVLAPTYNATTGLYTVPVQITNLTDAVIPNPVGIVLDSLTPGVTYVPTPPTQSGTFGGWPWQGESRGKELLPGHPTDFLLQFSNPSNLAISFNPILYQGTL